MLYTIVGEDITSSRKKLSELIEGTPDITRVDGEKESLSSILTIIESNSLFSQKRTVVIEHFLKVKPLDKFLEEVLKFVKDLETDIILWDEEEIDAKNKAKLKSAKNFSFSFPKYYYQFLDNIYPSSHGSIGLLREVLKTFEPEQVLYGLVRRIRQLLMVEAGGYEDFSDFKRMQSWQISRLRKQADLWSEAQLTKVFLELAELDEKIKTGGLTMPLSAHLDILLLSDLN